jgi:hypothetical protein
MDTVFSTVHNVRHNGLICRQFQDFLDETVRGVETSVFGSERELSRGKVLKMFFS